MRAVVATDDQHAAVAEESRAEAAAGAAHVGRRAESVCLRVEKLGGRCRRAVDPAAEDQHLARTQPDGAVPVASLEHRRPSDEALTVCLEKLGARRRAVAA
jgi:hypothetical protein